VLYYLFIISDFDDIEVPSSAAVPETSNITPFHVNAEDGLVSLSAQHFAELQQKVHRLASEVTNIIS
jgi:hypothetical protein